MLQIIRSHAAGVVVKILFVFLIASFAVWGIGDYAFLRQGEPTALTIGDTKITDSQFQVEYRREIERLRRGFGQFDAEAARQFGLVDRVVERVVNERLFDEAVARLGIAISDRDVRARILADPNFAGMTGAFDRNVLLQLLYENQLSESAFIDMMRRDLARRALILAIQGGGAAPEALVDRLYRYRMERRNGDFVLVPSAAMLEIGEPEEADIQAVYDDNADRLTVPETRALTLARIGVDDIAAKITPSEAQLREEFETRRAELNQPERREVEQVLFNDEETAKAAREKIIAGADFLEVAREAGQTPEQVKLGLVVPADILPEIAGVVFKLPQGEVSDVIRSAFGWHLARAAAIQPAIEARFEDARERMAREVARRLAGDSAYDVAVNIESALAAGTRLDEAARRVGLEPIVIEAVDARGRTPDGFPELNLAGAGEVLRAAFETEPGRESPLIETRAGIWFFVRVDRVTPARVKPLEEVREDVISIWKAERRQEAARKRADEIVERLAKGEKLEEAAGAFSLLVEAREGVTRDGQSPTGRVAPEIASRLFSLKQGEAAAAAGADGAYVVRLTAVRPADPNADGEAVNQVREELARQIGGDIVQEYAAALRARLGVDINRAVVDKI
jgi:peptidyl-prolyl cis-trans isomerase D